MTTPTVCPDCLAEGTIPPQSGLVRFCDRHTSRCERCGRGIPPDAEPLLALSGDPAYLCRGCRPFPGAGTVWLPSVEGEEQGASVAELLDAVGEGSANPDERRIKTGLGLTGQPLDRRDRDRILDAVFAARVAQAAR